MTSAKTWKISVGLLRFWESITKKTTKDKLSSQNISLLADKVSKTIKDERKLVDSALRLISMIVREKETALKNEKSDHEKKLETLEYDSRILAQMLENRKKT